MPTFIAILALIGLALVGFSLAARPRTEVPVPTIFTTVDPPMVPTEPDQRHHNDRLNDYLSRFNQWYGSLSESERKEFDDRTHAKLMSYKTPRGR